MLSGKCVRICFLGMAAFSVRRCLFVFGLIFGNLELPLCLVFQMRTDWVHLWVWYARFDDFFARCTSCDSPMMQPISLLRDSNDVKTALQQ